jgi:glycine/D-amino acid oxidase-like deaminating enzyme
MKSFHTIVAGLGAMGSAALYHLASRGVTTAGFDRFAPPHAMGSSHGETRMIREAYYEHPGYVPLVRRAYELWHQLSTDAHEIVIHETGGVYAGPDEPYLFGRIRISGPDPEHRSYRSFASFLDPDGNGWLLQELTTRLPGRIDSAATTFASVSDLASAMRRASKAHGEHEARTGGQRDENWPDWYAAYMVAEHAGNELPQ